MNIYWEGEFVTADFGDFVGLLNEFRGQAVTKENLKRVAEIVNGVAKNHGYCLHSMVEGVFLFARSA